MDLSVALILFNRPDKTRQVFREIARARPSRLFLIADGPREGHPEDREKCAAARQVVEDIDWECQVSRNFSETNLGCGARPATGISWVFQQVPSAVILEDDCVPHPSFFQYCQELLERYRDDERIGQISGSNFQSGHRRTDYSYYFSRHNICWGWASWSRAWRSFDMEMALWPELRDTGWLDDLLGVERAAKQWHDVFERAWARGATADFWDYQWTFACWSQSFFTILPNRTLISNIGVGQDATHTKRESKTTNLELEAMPFPLRHPTYVVRNVEADRFFFEQVTDRAGGKRRRTMRQRARRAIGRVFRRARGILEFRPKATGS